MAESCQVDFYVLAAPGLSPSELACRLCLKAWESGHRIALLAGGEAEANELDSLMWDCPPGRFLPHGQDSRGDAAPVRITTRAADLSADRDLVVNLAEAPIPEPGRFRRLLEIVPADERQRDASREKFRQYRALGLDCKKHDIQKL